MKSKPKKSGKVSEPKFRRYDELSVGDCVLMDSGKAGEYYVALVSSIGPSTDRRKPATFVAQWYYKLDDLVKDARNQVQDKTLENEVFLSPHKDRNSVEAIVDFCYVVSLKEYETIKDEIKRGFREKGYAYFVCRYKYYPAKASTSKAFEPVNETELFKSDHSTTRIGDAYQANIPALIAHKNDKRISDTVYSDRGCMPEWDLANHTLINKNVTHMWCPQVSITQAANLLLYNSFIDAIRYSIGNVVRTFQTGARVGHVRCLILSYVASEALLEVFTSDGEILKVLKSETCSLLTDDVALKNFYLCQYNISLAVKMCTEYLWNFEPQERDAFQRELVIKNKVLPSGADES